jgi:hypothetical protein
MPEDKQAGGKRFVPSSALLESQMCDMLVKKEKGRLAARQTDRLTLAFERLVKRTPLTATPNLLAPTRFSDDALQTRAPLQELRLRLHLNRQKVGDDRPSSGSVMRGTRYVVQFN